MRSKRTPPDALASKTMPLSSPERTTFHANAAVRAADRKGLESLSKYAARPPLAHERLQETSTGKLVYRMKTPWRNGATHVVMARIELIEKLAAIVPRPRRHLPRRHLVQ